MEGVDDDDDEDQAGILPKVSKSWGETLEYKFYRMISTQRFTTSSLSILLKLL